MCLRDVYRTVEPVCVLCGERKIWSEESKVWFCLCSYLGKPHYMFVPSFYVWYDPNSKEEKEDDVHPPG